MNPSRLPAYRRHIAKGDNKELSISLRTKHPLEAMGRAPIPVKVRTHVFSPRTPRSASRLVADPFRALPESNIQGFLFDSLKKFLSAPRLARPQFFGAFECISQFSTYSIREIATCWFVTFKVAVGVVCLAAGERCAIQPLTVKHDFYTKQLVIC